MTAACDSFVQVWVEHINFQIKIWNIMNHHTNRRISLYIVLSLKHFIINDKGSLPNPMSNTIPYFIAYNIIFYHLQNLDRCNMLEMFSKICLHRMSWQMLHFLPGLVNYKLIMQLNVFMIKLKFNIPISVTMIFLNNLVR